MRLWAMLTLCCLVVISVCSMNIDASDRFDAQSISDVLNRAKRMADDGPPEVPNPDGPPEVPNQDDGPTVDGNPDPDRNPDLDPEPAGADREEVRAEASAVDADIKEAQSDDTQKLLPDEVQKADSAREAIQAVVKELQASEDDEMKEELKAAEATAADFANIPQQAAQDLRATSSRRINPYYYYGYRRHCPCEPQCCDTRVLTVNTDYRNPGTYNADNVIGECLIDPYRWPTTWKNPCYRSALLKFKFDKISRYPCPGLCTNSGMCGRRLLRLKFTLSSYYYSRSLFPGIMLHIGDSRTNYPANGDNPDILNYDANAIGARFLFMVHGHQLCQWTSPLYFWGAIMPWVTKLEVLIGHNYIKVTNNYGYVREICNDCLFRLNGEYDRKEDCDSIYVGINRPISFGGFNPYAYHGAGVCKLEANWVCPWEDGCCENYPYGYPYYYSYPKSAAAAASSEPAPP